MAFKKCTVASAKVAATLTDYPTYVDLDRVGVTTLAEAQSIRVYADESKTTEWAREIVSATEMHVKIPSLTTTTTIYVDYDGVRSDYAVTDTYGRNAVWAGYYAVSHNGGFDVDATGNGRTFTASGGITQGGASGFFGDGTFFDGTNDQLESTDATLRAISKTHDFTFSSWVKPDRLTNVDLLLSFGTVGDSANIFAVYPNDTVTAVGGLRVFWRATSPNAWVDEAGADLKDVWQYLYISSTSTTSHSARRNGALVVNSTLSAAAQTYSYTRFGNWNGGQWFQGTSAEVRFSKTALSADWHTTEYNNQSDEATFWPTWEDVGGGAVAKKGFLAWL